MESQEFLKREFVHYISDTIALLGGEERIVNLIRDGEEKQFTPHLIDEIRKYNCNLIDEIKSRLVLMNTITVEIKN